MESAGGTPPEAPSSNQPAKEPAADTVRPVGQSKKIYFIVIVLVGFAMELIPSLFALEFDIHIIPIYAGQSPFSVQVLFQIANLAEFLISPCLFFTILYFYGKRTTCHFSESYLTAILFLFMGSALGYAAGILLPVPLLGEGVSFLDSTFWLEFASGIVFVSVRQALVGFSALGLSYLRTRYLTSPSVPA